MQSTAEVVRNAMRSLVPPEPIRMADWMRQNFYTDEGKAFDEYSVPWVTAPNGPCEAIDNPQYNLVWLQWAARMFKTQFGQGAMAMHADRDPCRMMFATPDETMCKGVFGRFWLMLAHCPPIRNQVPAERLRSKTHIKLKRCEIHGAWPRGKSRLADKSIRVGHGNEIDKWVVESTTTEGHPLARFLKRGDQYPDRKFILESTPGQRLHSLVETGRLQSTNCKYWVPCPHCGKFAPLSKGDGEKAPGLFWAKDAAGRSNAELALKTAYYVCGECEQHIYDIHRPDMMNAGVWVHEGCTVDHDRAMRAREFAPDERHRWMKGEPTRDAKEYGSQISVLYALFHGWGDIAERYIRCKGRTQMLRQFLNEDLAETWEITERKDGPEKIGERLIIACPRGVVPLGFSVVTVGIDKQKNHYPYVVKAWAPGGRSHTLQYGEFGEDLSELRALLATSWPHQDGGPRVTLRGALIDSGHFPKDVARFVADCKRCSIPILACKGSNTKLEALYRKSVQGKDSAMPGQMLVIVDTAESQDWIEDVLHKLKPEDPWGMSIHAGSYADHEEYIAQLLNDAPVDRVDTRGNAQISWDRIDESVPNDWRDCERYAMVAGAMVCPRASYPVRISTHVVEDTAERSQGFVRKPQRAIGSGFVRRRT